MGRRMEVCHEHARAAHDDGEEDLSISRPPATRRASPGLQQLPPGDGGGRSEVAGINERFNKAVADRLVDLIEAGDYDRAEELLREFVASGTDVVVTWSKIPAIESYLRDTLFNRGHAAPPRSCKWFSGGARRCPSSARVRVPCLPWPSRTPLGFSTTFARRVSATSVQWSGVTRAANSGRGS
jgi:hypothetical protein